ncbi:hypothetical protein [Kitasatospora sp. NPDC017646]
MAQNRSRPSELRATSVRQIAGEERELSRLELPTELVVRQSS